MQIGQGQTSGWILEGKWSRDLCLAICIIFLRFLQPNLRCVRTESSLEEAILEGLGWDDSTPGGIGESNEESPLVEWAFDISKETSFKGGEKLTSCRLGGTFFAYWIILTVGLREREERRGSASVAAFADKYPSSSGYFFRKSYYLKPIIILKPTQTYVKLKISIK